MSDMTCNKCGNERTVGCPNCEQYDFSEKNARIAALESQLAEANERASELEKRRGGECDTCGGWVCPPLRCVGCMMKQRITPNADPSILLADALQKQDSDLAELRSQLAAAVRRAEDAERAVNDLALEVATRREGGKNYIRNATRGSGVLKNWQQAVARSKARADANPIAAAAIERARGGTDGE